MEKALHNTLYEDLLSGTHLWIVENDSAISQCGLEMLTFSEMKRLEGVRRIRVRNEYTAARLCLRAILSRYLSLHPREIDIAAGPWGKPYLGSGSHDVLFNVSHSGKYIAVALSRRGDVGVDIETIRETPWACEVADQFFAPSEAKELIDGGPNRLSERFLRYWTLKEACVKATGLGLSLSLSSFQVKLPAYGENALVGFSSNTPFKSGWTVQSVEGGEGMILAIASSATINPLRLFRERLEDVERHDLRNG